VDEDRDNTDLEGLPLRASGTFEGYVWEFRGDILNGEAHTSVYFRDSFGTGAGGGGIGALPLQKTGWKTTGHIGTVGWSRGESASRGKPSTPSFLSGVVSDAVARIEISLTDGTVANPTILDSGEPAVRFFVLTVTGGLGWREIIALDAAGQPLERMSKDSWPA
jgi:hypothetical protein